MTKKEFVSRYLPVLLWAIVIFAFSANPKPYSALPQSWSQPVTSVPSTPSTDEILGRFLHVGEYIVLAFLVSWMIVWRNRISSSALLFVIGLSSLYALSDEIHQHFVPGRAFQWSDLLLDLTGILIGTLVFFLVKRLGRNRAPGT